MVRLILALLACAPLLEAQTDLFQSLDNPIPTLTGIEAAGDLDGDGDPDLLFPGGALINDGHGRFTKYAVASMSFPRQSARLVDVNADGLADIVSVGPVASAPTHVRVDLNLGTHFALGQLLTAAYPVGATPGSFATGDVDGDGDVDILVGMATPMQTSTSPALWLNDGSGTFTQAPWTSVPASPLPANHVLLVDLDGDGDHDAVFGSLTSALPTGVMTAINNGGVFTAGATPLWGNGVWGLADGSFNSDTIADLVLSDGVSTAVFLGSPTGYQTPTVTPAPPYSGLGLLGTVDVNGDGIDEIIQETWPHSLAVHPVAPSGAVGPPLQSWNDLYLNAFSGSETIVRDLDGDGDQDVIATTISEATALMNHGSSGFDRAGGRLAGVSMAMTSQNVDDLDADGDLDLLAYDWNSFVVTAINDGDGFFGPGPTSSAVPTNPFYILRTFDRDGDGDLDIWAMLALLGGPTPLGPDLVFDNAAGTFSQVATVPGTGDGRSFQSADLDGDGDQDVVIGRWMTAAPPAGPLSFIRNLGPAGFSTPVALGTVHATYDVDLADFDGNGTTDIFQTNAAPPWSTAVENCVVYLNTGGGAFTPVVQNGMTGRFAAAGDLNGDGKADLVLDGQVRFSAAGGSFVAGPTLPSPLQNPASLVDVDLDGDLDLVETPATVRFNAGGGLFGPPHSYLPPQIADPDYYQEVPGSAVVDLDHDGDPDIVAPGPILLMNKTHQIAHGSIPRPGRPASIEVYGTPGGSWLLFGASGTASFPLPPWGQVLIDPTSALLGATGTLAPAGSTAAGSSSFGVSVPNNPTLVGWTTWWQAIDANASRFTNRITITVRSF